MTVTVWTDNTATEGMISHLWGTATFIPLLKQLWLIMVKHDIRLAARHISSKDNVISDALSRGDWTTFASEVGMGTAMAGALARRCGDARAELVRVWRSRALVVSDYDDWKLDESIFNELNDEWGPFQVDACVDELRANAQCDRSWNRADDATRQDWDGLCAYCNPPFSFILPILYRFLVCKLRHLMGTSAVFVLPMWLGSPHWDFILRFPTDFEIVRRFQPGSLLFTSPNIAGNIRKSCGPTRWPVALVRIGPGEISPELGEFASSCEHSAPV